MSPLEDALSLAGEGLRVFACEPRGKRPLAAAAPHGCHSATTDLAVITDIWSRYPTANVGVATGDGILVLDVDGDEGVLTLTELGPLPRTRSVRTGTGYHFYFRAEGVDLKNTARKLGAGLDTRGTGGYVIASGTHPSGAEYQGDDLPIADAPPWLVAALLAPDRKRDPVAAVVRIGDTTPYGQRALEDETRRVESAPEGEGNDTLNRAAFALGQLEAGGEIAYGESQRALEDAAASWEHPDRGSTATIRSGLQGGRSDPRSAPLRLQAVSPSGDLGTTEHPVDELGSWRFLDLVEVGNEKPEPASIAGLFYPLVRHLVFGSHSSAKTWLVACAAATVIQDGGTVAWVDIDGGNAGDLLERFEQLGLTHEQITSQLIYIQPEELLSTQRAAIVRARIQIMNVTLSVVDSATGSMALEELEPNDGTDIEKWWQRIGTILRGPNGAVVLIDHVGNSPDNQGRPVASARKLQAVGCAFALSTIEPLTRGTTGRSRITIAKDRPSFHGPRGTTLANLRIESNPDTGAITWRLDPATAQTAPYFRPTGIMERVSHFLYHAPGAHSHTSIRESVRGKTEYVTQAIAALVIEGFASEEQHGQARKVTHSRVFRESEDAENERERVASRSLPVPGNDEPDMDATRSLEETPHIWLNDEE